MINEKEPVWNQISLDAIDKISKQFCHNANKILITVAPGSNDMVTNKQSPQIKQGNQRWLVPAVQDNV
jgi:hypothetical protein